jgi:hypothetical protein
MTVAVDSEDVRRSHVRVDRALVHTDEAEAPIAQELAGRAHRVELGEPRPGVVLVKRRLLHDGAVVLDVVPAPDLVDAASQDMAEARAGQFASIQALDGHRGPTPAGRGTGVERPTEVADQGGHQGILSPIEMVRPLASTRVRPNDRALLGRPGPLPPGFGRPIASPHRGAPATSRSIDPSPGHSPFAAETPHVRPINPDPSSGRGAFNPRSGPMIGGRRDEADRSNLWIGARSSRSSRARRATVWGGPGSVSRPRGAVARSDRENSSRP